MKLNLQVQKLDIIFVTDIHNSREHLQKLSEYVRNNALHFDYFLVGGDVVNCDHNLNTHQQAKESEQFSEILTFLHDLFQCKVLFIPGNHDPLGFIRGDQHLSPEIINIHKREYVLEQGLSIVGLGGSLPGYSDIEYKTKVWEGYPYQSEEQYEKDINQVFHQDELNTSKIYMTHMGPALSNTSIVRFGKQPPVYAGSKALDKIDQHESLLVHLHGHVHLGGRYDLFNGKPIVNPGSLKNGDYAILKLVRDQKKWKLVTTSFLNLL